MHDDEDILLTDNRRNSFMKKILAVFFFLILLFSVPVVQAEKKAQESFRIVDRKKLPAQVTERQLTDDEIAEISKDSLESLKKKLSKYGDFIAWVRIALLPEMEFYELTTSDGDHQFTFGARFSFSWLGSWFSPNMTVSIAQYVLEDDCPGIGTLCFFLKNGNDLEMKCCNYIPADGGYYLMNPEMFIDVDRNKLQNSCALEDMLFVSDLSALPQYYSKNRKPRQVVQILALESAEDVVLDYEGHRYIPRDMTHVVSIYYDETAKYPPKGSKLDMKGYGFPKGMSSGSGIDVDTARKIENGTYEEAAAAIKTVPDVLSYLYYTGFSPYGIDETVEMHDGVWHYNLKPDIAFKIGRGGCGRISGLVAGLLEEDYDEVGLITLRSPYDGHVINYIKDGDLYYVFDGMAWVVSGYDRYNLFFCYAETLEKAAMKYSKTHDTRMMVAYMNPRGGDLPTIFHDNACKIPSHYCDVTILQETPEEGYVYIMVEEDPAAMEAIDRIRGVW